MNIKEIIENIETFPEDATLFAERINGEHRADSEVVLIQLSDEEMNKPIKEIAQQKASGKEYFLEVFIIKEVLEGWRSNHEGKSPSIEAALESVIYYSENDAYPESFFG